MTNKEIQQLINKYLEGETSPEEERLLALALQGDDQPEEWIYSGDGRPEACPLIEIKECSE